MALCKKGLHELSEPGAFDESVPGKFRCAACRRETQLAYRRKQAAQRLKERGNRCHNGHTYTAKNSKWCVRQGHRYRLCMTCQRASFLATKRGDPGRPSAGGISSDTDRTRRFLDLCEAWEREMRADLKAELAQQIARMRA